MYEVERVEGRLIEARIASPLTAREVDGIIQSVRMNVIALPEKVICVADLTRLDAIPSEAADAFVAMFTRDNPKVERSALLLSPHASVVSLQLSRMIRAAKSTSRMAFEDAGALHAWLEDVLRPAEKERLRVFLEAVDATPRGEPPSSKSARRPPSE